MKKKKVLFRVDGSVQIGLGHLVRCMALAQMIENDFEITFICKEIPENIVAEIKILGYILSVIGTETDFLRKLNEDAIVVLDHYGLDSNYQKSIKSIGCKLVCIDDLHDRLFFADLIINHAPNIDPVDYKAQTYTQFALGLNYALLRPVFLSKAKAGKTEKSDGVVFVCFGGSDTKNITQVVVEILKIDKRFSKIIIVVGGAYSFLDYLKNSIAKESRFCVYHSINSDLVCDLISQAEIAIVPASGILQEVIALGGKAISGMYVENQKRIFDNYKALDAFYSAENFSKEDIITAINLSFEDLKLTDRKLIDGNSGERILKYFRQFEIEDQIVVRNAEITDLFQTFKWASNREIRKFFFSNQDILFSDHQKWFITKLKDKNCFYYLGVMDDKPVGSIRFDVETDVGNISYLVDPESQNKGLGTVLLKKGLDLFLMQVPDKISKICGEVFKENTASIKVFKNLGYRKDPDSADKVVRFRKIL